MASSLIRINEATVAELQQLRGIGPKRANYIERYRNEVTPICNTYDLAAATGLSHRAAIKLAEELSFDHTGTPEQAWAAIVIAATSLLLIVLGFSELASSPFDGAGGLYNLALALVLLAGFAAAGDIAVAQVRKSESETTIVFWIALATGGIGITMLCALLIADNFLTFDQVLSDALTTTGAYLLFCVAILWQIYGPTMLMRFLIAERMNPRLDIARQLYELSQVMLPILAVCALILVDSTTWTEEFFGVWCFASALYATSELHKGRSPFLSVLPETDQGRLRFAYQRSGLQQSEPLLPISRLKWLGLTMIALSAIFIGVSAVAV